MLYHLLQLSLGTVHPLLCCSLVNGFEVPLCLIAAAFPTDGQTAGGTCVGGGDVVVAALLVLGGTYVDAGNLLLCHRCNALDVEVECSSVGVGGFCQLGIGVCGNAAEDLTLVHVYEAVLCGFALHGFHLPKELGGRSELSPAQVCLTALVKRAEGLDGSRYVVVGDVLYVAFLGIAILAFGKAELGVVDISLFLCEVGGVLNRVVPCPHAVDGIVARGNAGKCQGNLVGQHGIVCVGVLLCVSLQVLGGGELALHVLYVFLRVVHQLLHLSMQRQEGVDILLAVVAGLGAHVHSVDKFLYEHAILCGAYLAVLDDQAVECLGVQVGLAGNDDAVQLPEHVATDALVAQRWVGVARVLGSHLAFAIAIKTPPVACAVMNYAL